MVVVGVLLGVGGSLEVGELTAFLFLVALFVQPVQIATEVLNEAQNAVAGWRRVLDVLDVEPDVSDPGATTVATCPPGRSTCASPRCDFAYPQDGASGLGRTCSARWRSPSRPGRASLSWGRPDPGKTTFAKLLTRLMDPTRGRYCFPGSH